MAPGDRFQPTDRDRRPGGAEVGPVPRSRKKFGEAPGASSFFGSRVLALSRVAPRGWHENHWPARPPAARSSRRRIRAHYRFRFSFAKMRASSVCISLISGRGIVNLDGQLQEIIEELLAHGISLDLAKKEFEKKYIVGAVKRIVRKSRTRRVVARHPPQHAPQQGRHPEHPPAAREVPRVARTSPRRSDSSQPRSSAQRGSDPGSCSEGSRTRAGLRLSGPSRPATFSACPAGRLVALDRVLEVAEALAEPFAELGELEAPKMMSTISRMISSSGTPSDPNIVFSFVRARDAGRRAFSLTEGPGSGLSGSAPNRASSLRPRGAGPPGPARRAGSGGRGRPCRATIARANVPQTFQARWRRTRSQAPGEGVGVDAAARGEAGHDSARRLRRHPRQGRALPQQGGEVVGVRSASAGPGSR